MKNNTMPLVAIVVLAGALAFTTAHSETTIKEETKEVIQDVQKGARKTVRKVQDETCEMVDGKAKCVAKKIKHKAENIKDDIKDATN